MYKKIKLIPTLIGLAIASQLLFSGSVLARHVYIEAEAVCDEALGFFINYTSKSWCFNDPGTGCGNSRIDITLDGSLVESGAYTHPDYSFSNSKSVDYASGQVVTVKAYAFDDWDSGAAGGQTAETDVTIPDDCTPPPPECGDGEVNQASEQCDDGNKVDEGDDCRNNCTLPYCGDGYIDTGETCDDGNNENGDGCSAVCDEEPEGGQGCTPGYWKQKQHSFAWTDYTTETLFDDIFEDTFTGMSLLEVLKQGGGGIKALGRHTVAALLNSASSDVEYNATVESVISAFNAAAAGNTDIEGQKNIFNDFNEQGCPLGNDKK